MRSPFPGMDPYLENPAVWPDFHMRMIYGLSEALNPQLSPRYVIRAEAQMYIHELADDWQGLIGQADDGVSRGLYPGSASATVLEPPPVWGTMPTVDIERVHYLEIRDRAGREVVTVIELLSPTNKREPDREHYIAKRVRLRQTCVHLVEIDLLRGGIGPRLPVCRIAITTRSSVDRTMHLESGCGPSTFTIGCPSSRFP